MRFCTTVLVVVASLFLLVMAGCSGTGGAAVGESVSGVAATGAPIYGTVSLKDAKGVERGPVTTDDGGNFSIDISGLTAPFLLKAQWVSGGQTYSLCSVATGAGTANINPLSDLVVQVATGTTPSQLYAGAVPDTSRLSRMDLNSAQSKVKTMMAPVLNAYGITSFDPVSGEYTATPDNRVDAMLDVLSFTVQGNTLSVTNRVTGSVIGTAQVAAVGDATMNTSMMPSATVLDDIRDISARLNTLCSTLNLGTKLFASDLEGFFIADPYYGTSIGSNRAQDIASIVAIFGPNGSNTIGPLKSIRNLRIIQPLTGYSAGRVDRVYLVRFDLIFQDGTIVHGSAVSFGRESATGLWKFIGAAPARNAGNAGSIITTGNAGASGTLVTSTLTSGSAN